MKFISIDLEFSSLNLEDAKILEFGAIIEDSKLKLPFEECPKFHCLINHKKLTGEIYALAMNSDILKTLAKIDDIKDKEEKTKYIKENNILNDYEVTESFFHFLYDNGMCEKSFKDANYVNIVNKNIYPAISSKLPKTKIILAGKNLYSKDIPLLKTLPRWNEVFILSHKSIDPAINFIDWNSDEDVPSLSECKKRAGFVDKVSHRAIDDAWDVIQLLRTNY